MFLLFVTSGPQCGCLDMDEFLAGRNVVARLVWGVSVVRSFADIIQYHLICLGSSICEVARPNKIVLRISR